MNNPRSEGYEAERPRRGRLTRHAVRGVSTAVVILLASMGCSVTSLQCGVDGDSSFVNLNTTPATLSQTSRQMAELCGFAYEEQTNG